MNDPQLRRRGLLSVGLTGALGLAACQKTENLVGAGTVAGSRTGGFGPATGVDATAARAKPDMARVIEALKAQGTQPIETLTVAQARTQPFIPQAVMRVARETGRSAAPVPLARVEDISIPGPGGAFPARIYSAHARSRGAPLIVYWHGGGWVIADLDTYDASARALAAQTGAIVLSAHYRQAPEAKFPAAHEDALAAYRWALGNAQRLGADRSRIAVAGESAGGNLAIATAIAARDAGLPLPRHMALIYPVAGTDTATPSYRENSAAAPLSRAGMLWFVDKVTSSSADLQDPRLNLVGRADLRGLPPATIINAEIDPLRSEGEMLAAKLREAGVPVTQRTFQGVTHEFFGMSPVVADAAEAQAMAAQALTAALGAGGRRA